MTMRALSSLFRNLEKATFYMPQPGTVNAEHGILWKLGKVQAFTRARMEGKHGRSLRPKPADFPQGMALEG